MSTAWTQQQLDAIQLRDAELVVSAAAGSGKTAVLIERVLRLALDDGIDLDRMLLVTFTRTAAAELRERLSSELRARSSSYPRELVRRQLAALPRAQISTLHSFCLGIVQRYGYLQGIGASRVLSEGESALARHELAGSVVRMELDAAGPELREAALSWGGSDGVGAEDLSSRHGGAGLRKLVLDLHDFSMSLPDPNAWRAAHLGLPPLDEVRCDVEHPAVAAAINSLRRWCDELLHADAELIEALNAHGGTPHVVTHLQRRRSAVQQIAASDDWDAIGQRLARLQEKQDDLKQKPQLIGLYRQGVEGRLYGCIEAVSSAAKDRWHKLCEFFGSPWAEVARRHNATAQRLGALWELAQRFDERYAEFKRQRGAADYNDLERGALALMRNPQVAAEQRQQYQHILIDEYQDTSPLQDAILDLITPDAAAGRPRFIVGDVKQSIYAFRLAEPSLFRGHQQRLDSAQSGAALRLTHNFRSRVPVIAAINHLFEGLMDASLGGEEYAENRLLPGFDYRAADGGCPEHPVRLHLVEVGSVGPVAPASVPAKGSEPSRSPEPPQRAVLPRPDVRPTGDNPTAVITEEDPDDPAEVQLAVYRKIAAILCEVHAGGQMVYDKVLRNADGTLGGMRRVQWRDMAVLLRTSRGRVETLRRELTRAGVPNYSPGRSGFYERPEIGDALALLAAVDNPRHDVPLATVLTGPAVGLGAEQLAGITGGECLWESVQQYIAAGSDAGLREVLAAFAARLGDWRDVALGPLDGLLWRLYQESGLLAAAAANYGHRQPGGQQRLANLMALHERAGQFSQQGAAGLPRFLRFIEGSRRAAGDVGEAPLAAETRDVVRVLTVHQAKGLEFPVVVVADMQRQFHIPELYGDVLWHYRAGIGGRYVELDGQLRRDDTLALRAVRAARKRDAISEELRILYVALTRARERLELVGAVQPGFAGKLTETHRGLEARSWLDWVGPQLGEAVREAAERGQSRAGADSCWEVRWERASELKQPHAGEKTGSADPSSEEIGALLERLEWSYPQAASDVPAKLAITRASSGIELDLEDRAVLIVEAMPEPAAVHPVFIYTAPPTKAEIGTAVHRLIAELDPASLDYAQYADPERLGKLLSGLVRRGYIAASAAREIELEPVAAMVAELSSRLPRELGGELRRSFRELPVNLLVPAGEILVLQAAVPADNSAEQREAEKRVKDSASLREAQGAQPRRAAPPDEMVHLQGAIDLLLDNGTEALVLDYKTGYTADAALLSELHRQQLHWYCRAVSQLLPGRRVRWALYGLSGAGFVGPFEFIDTWLTT